MSRSLRRLVILFAAVGAVSLAAPDLDARPGGGSTFKSPSRSSSGSSSRSGSGSSSRSGSGSSSRSSSGSGSSSRSSSGSGSGSRGGSWSWPRSSPGSSSPSPSYPSGPSSGSSSSPSHHHDRDYSFTGFFFFLLVAIALLVLGVVLYNRWNNGLRHPDWDTEPDDDAANRQRSHTQRYQSLVAALGAIRRFSPSFSFVLFEDFLYALYAEAHAARGRNELSQLSPYLGPDARTSLSALGNREVRSIVIGSLRVEEVEVNADDGSLAVQVGFETNYEEITPGGEVEAFYSAERWRLTRAAGVKDRPPEKARVIGCPNCGAPLDKIVGGVCKYCSKHVESSDYDWVAQSIAVLQREPRPPMLTGTVEEVGTSDPTIVAPDVKGRWSALTDRDPQVDWAKLTARIELIFRKFHEGWTTRELSVVRPFLSDNLFQAQTYWIDAYKRQGLQNRTDGARIVSIQLARVVQDAHYDAITVRVFATGLDYTVNDAGEVVSGSKEREREYTEYWTLIRGADRTGAPRADLACPNCGAPLDINMAGHCAHCQAKVTAGEFDWVLSRIEQDEVYG